MIQFARSPGGSPPGGRANGSKKKTFELNGKHKRLIRSSSVRLFLKKRYRILFCTLTFPDPIDQAEANKCFSNYVDNLKTNYNLTDYVAVKENTKQGRPHFHCLFDLPYTDYKKLNRAWCATFPINMRTSRNAFTTGRNPIISDISTVVRYITKYITKVDASKNQVKPTTRQYFISNGTAAKPELIPEWIRDYLKHKYGYEYFESDFFTWYRLYNFAAIPEEILKQLDPPPKKKPKKLTRKRVNPDANQLQFDKNMGVKVVLHYNS